MSCIFHKHLRSSCGAERKFVKKIYRSEFLQSSFIFVIYLSKEIYRKIMSEIHLWAKLDMRILQRLALKGKKNEENLLILRLLIYMLADLCSKLRRCTGFCAKQGRI